MNEQGSFKEDYAARFHGAEIAKDLRRTIPLDQEQQGRKAAEHFNNLREELRAEIPQNLTGIDTAGVQAYFDHLGLAHRDYLVMDQLSTFEYNAIMKKYGGPGYPPLGNDGSAHYGVTPVGLDMAVVRRDPTMEHRYGMVFTEAHLVHELAHASSNWNEWTIITDGENRSLSAKRIGQQVLERDDNSLIIPHHGFIEEGFAAKVTSDYLKWKNTLLAFKNYADTAGAALEAISQVEPEFFPALIQGRTHVDGLRKVAQLLNKLEPKLYERLQHIPYSEAGFTDGAGRVYAAVHRYQDRAQLTK